MRFEPAFDTPAPSGPGRRSGGIVPPALQRALRREAGTFGDVVRTAIVGFEGGGPVSTVSAPGPEPWSTHLTTELAASALVERGRAGGHELLVTADDAALAQDLLTAVARAGSSDVLRHGGLVRLTAWDGPGGLRGAVLEEVARAKVGGRAVRVLRCHGLLASELRWAGEHGGPAILRRLAKARVPGISRRRRPSVESPR
ncbi:MAG: hypothetical protein QM704_27160 [Anaeromyxobacteraceae bacterium]